MRQRPTLSRFREDAELRAEEAALRTTPLGGVLLYKGLSHRSEEVRSQELTLVFVALHDLRGHAGFGERAISKEVV